MSKVDTLLKLIADQKQHPHASDEEIAQRIGISARHVRRCKQEEHLLRSQLSEWALAPDQARFLLSLLNPRDPHHLPISQQLQKLLGVSYTGRLSLARKGEQPPLESLAIGGLIPAGTEACAPLPPALHFWLENLCYDPLLVFHRNGDIEARLATDCFPVERHASRSGTRLDFSQWMVTLRTDLRWSDGKPITRTEVMGAFSLSRLASILTEIVPDGKTQLRLRLSQAEPLLPLRLRGIFVLPSPKTSLYRVVSGPYRLKRFRPAASTFRFEPNPAYYRDKETNIDWLTLTRFTHPANALRALEREKLDLLPLRALQSLYQFPKWMAAQQWPFFEDNYHVLFLNRHRGLLSDPSNCHRLKEAIDYRAIQLYLHMGQTPDESEIASPHHTTLDVRVADSGGEARYLAYLISPLYALRADCFRNLPKSSDILREFLQATPPYRGRPEFLVLRLEQVSTPTPQSGILSMFPPHRGFHPDSMAMVHVVPRDAVQSVRVSERILSQSPPRCSQERSAKRPHRQQEADL